ncbi:MAG: coenzyme F420 hydrogenase [Betaproteobacteria bacterium]|nr:coenzyme F420 hydrogenase [Betaproteobacteria bacterium]
MPWPQSDPTREDAAFRQLCTDCGISRTAKAKRCAQACQFIKPEYERLEIMVHGRSRGQPLAQVLREPVQEKAKAQPSNHSAADQATPPALGDESFFGPMQAMYRAKLQQPLKGKPTPVIVTAPDELAQCRGMRMGYAPLLALIEPALARGLKRLAVIGIPCQVYALRALHADWEQQGLASLYVIGTPCSDNTHTERFHQFLALLDPHPETIHYLEFRADYHVELRFSDGRKRLIPFLQLPLSTLPPDFFPTTCKSCVDYSNVLADITVGYMGGSGDQWLIVRNAKGRFMLDQLQGQIDLTAPAQAGKRSGAVKAFHENLLKAAGGLPLRRMPDWLRPIVGWLMPRIGPRGLEFARARIEMKAIETIVTLRQQHPARIKSMVPKHVWQLASAYGIEPQAGEHEHPSSREAAAARSPPGKQVTKGIEH